MYIIYNYIYIYTYVYTYIHISYQSCIAARPTTRGAARAAVRRGWESAL